MKPADAPDDGRRQVIADRYQLVERIAAGGQGTVYRGRDLRDGRTVAVKVASNLIAGELGRFEDEAAILSAVSHPAVVRYLDHGAAGASAYLVMEWLEGETLATRLARGPLAPGQALALGAAVTGALGVLHGLGLIHRDVKPSNLFLRDGDPTRPVLLDLGIARRLDGGGGPAGAAGTPAYAAPEQAQGRADLDERADFFALGCVLFHALAGRPPYVGANVPAVLAKIALLPSPSLAEVAPGVPRAASELVARLLAKEPQGRPRDAAAVLALLAAAERDEELPPEPPRRLGRTEHEILSVVMTARASAPESSPVTRVIEAPGDESGTHLEVRDLGETAVLAVRSGPSAAAQALRAARYALELRQQSPEAAVAVATGPGIVALALPVGGVIDTAASLVAAEAERSRAAGEPPRIVVDRATAGLVMHELEVHPEEGAFVLVGPLAAAASVEGPFVGRERELAALVTSFDECRAAARPARWLICGPPGSGKSRLASELCAIARALDDRVVIWSGRGDPLRTGSPYSLLGSLRRGAGESSPPPVSAQPLALTPLGDATEASLGTGEPAGAEAVLEDAVRDFEVWLAGLGDGGPAVLVLDDLHWGDLPSLRLLAAALRARGPRRLMLVALARPDVHARFGGELLDLEAEPMMLGELEREARLRLAARILGVAPEAPEAQRLVEHAGGLPLFLEEMALVTRGGTGLEAGETMSAMVATRMKALPPAARELLRAGSIFGQHFWLRGAEVLLGGGPIPEAAVEALLRADLLREPEGSRLPGERELAFRHVVLRDAAYALLTDEDRRHGHGLAARWLEGAGEVDAETLAVHHERAGDLPAAAGAYEMAAGRALRAADFAAASRLADAGMRCSAKGEVGLRLLHVAIESLNWLGEGARARQLALDADARLAPGTAASARVLSELAITSGMLGDQEMLLIIQERVAALLRHAVDMSDPDSCAHARAGATVVFALSLGGYRPLVDPWLLAFLERQAPGGTAAADERLWGDVLTARGTVAMYEDEPERAAELLGGAGDAYQRAGSVAQARAQWANAAHVLLDLGAHEEALALLARSLHEKDGRTRWENHSASAASNLGRALIVSGRLDEGIAVIEELLARVGRRILRRYLGTAEMYLADAFRRQGDATRARGLAAQACSALADFPTVTAPAEAIHAEALLALGEPAAALERAAEAVRLLEKMGGVEERESLIRLVHARALAGAGRTAEARAALAAARDRLQARAARLSPARRRGFLEDVAENRATLELAVAWGLGPPAPR